MFRATQKIKTWLIACLMAVVTALVAVSTCLLPTSTVSAETVWQLVTSVGDLNVGDQIIIAAKDSEAALSTNQKSNNRGQAAIAKDGDTVTFEADVQIITLEAGTVDGTFAFYVTGTSTGYLYAAGGTGKNNYLKTQDSLTAASSWNITIDSTTGAATIKTADSTVVRHTLMHNSSSSLFSCYASGQQAIVIYKGVETNPGCTHESVTTYKDNKDGTHTTVCDGCGNEVDASVTSPCEYVYVEGEYTCNDAGEHSQTGACACGATNTKTETCTIPEYINYLPQGDKTHAKEGICTICNYTSHFVEACTEFNTVVTDPTADTDGYTTYTCTDCGYSYQDDFVPATGSTTYTVDFVVPTGVTKVASKEIAEGYPVELPDLANPVGYTFVGWTTEVVEETQTLPTVYTTEYTVTENKTFYALYSKQVAGEESYVKVTKAPADWSGKYLIVYEESDSAAYVFNGKDAVNGYVSATITDGTINPTEEINNVAVTIATMTDGYSIHTPGGYIYGNSSSNKLSFDSSAKLNTIALETDGSATITSGRVLRFNDASNQMRFRYYTSGSQKPVYLYKFGSMITTTYQTLEEATIINSASITVKDDLTLNYYVGLETQYQGAQMKFTMGEETTIVDGVLQQDGRYKYSFENIAPQQMGENVKAELIFDGEVLASIDEYSIKAYAQKMLNNGANEKLQRLLTDLLYYGDEAQKYLGMEATTTAGVTGLAEKATATPTETQLVIGDAKLPAWFSAAGLKFDNVNQLYVKVTGDLEGVSVTVTKNDGEAVEGEVIQTAEGVLYYTDGVIATEFDTVYTFVLSVNGVELQTLTYNVNSYVYAMQNSSTASASMKALATALYNYGLAAEAYAA